MQTFSALSKTKERNAKELSCVAKPLLEKALFLTAVTWHKKAPLSIIASMRSLLKKHGKVNFVLRLYVKRYLIFRCVLFYCLGFLSETSLIEYFLRFLVSKGPQWDIYEALILGGTKGSSYKVKIQNSKLNLIGTMHTFCKIKGGSNLVPRGRATLVQPNVGRSTWTPAGTRFRSWRWFHQPPQER